MGIPGDAGAKHVLSDEDQVERLRGYHRRAIQLREHPESIRPRELTAFVRETVAWFESLSPEQLPPLRQVSPETLRDVIEGDLPALLDGVGEHRFHALDVLRPAAGRKLLVTFGALIPKILCRLPREEWSKLKATRLFNATLQPPRGWRRIKVAGAYRDYKEVKAVLEAAPGGAAAGYSDEQLAKFAETLDKMIKTPVPKVNLPELLKQDATASTRTRIPVPEGTTWEEVSIRFVSDERVQVTAGSTTPTLNYVELGFEDTRKGKHGSKPINAWQVLRELAVHGGRLEIDDDLKPGRPNIEKAIQVIRRKLRSATGIQGDLIQWNRKDRSYESVFRLSFPDHDRL